MMTMHKFAYANATTVKEVVETLSDTCRPLAGGTDFVTRMKDGLAAPERLVNLKTLAGLRAIHQGENGWTVGTLTTLHEVTANAELNASPSLACLVQAAAGAASPQIRHTATLGGNLLQQPRCWYYRNPDIPCWRKGGDRCYAVLGENQYHVILNRRSPCHAVHPSDPAVALLALDAQVTLVDPLQTRSLALGKLYRLPSNDWRSDTVVQPNALLTWINVPRMPEDTRSVYVKAAERSSWDFALASTAVVLTFEGEHVTRARIALGGVAVNPLRQAAAEEVLLGKVLDEKVIDEAASLSVEGAQPMSQNAYKVELVKGVVKQALTSLRKN